ncbi:LysM peptidoglycan-binding domain-containing protein [Vibrio vulnificus]|uniref:LysM peptidoglycan-binding domain-containing protein n=1 Tax=Vibrio vulnificus TaxID=672 RepID=UPI0003073B17|nr:LysM peptidoglycan-binding domain-containing protein [Vibrio vulnificus]EGQ7932011.1 LysM peptidoglycan-binding domain-containing protein [Vibrio vulnificus]EGQ8073796.1 LysM peptidoglycan-binding domain-containing protein [Vibrio vulnificus]EGQ9283761.1 LysM peptidoglycan-binding domain-containing protein [Vibrio vulnificus]EGQ9971460.1 LysM peptidoglycan-binding domain-containing protein [Vibrio vulnificus]EHK8977113.1 LysM peptidoglycan-binding domain-containing protein [Vibrio vulnificu
MNSVLQAASRVLLPLLFSVSVAAQESPAPLNIKPDAPQTYVVVKGDTLWDISALYLDSSWLWPRLWQINPDIDNPHLIYPGDKLSLVWKNGQPMLSLKPVVTLSPKARITEKKAVPTVDEGLVMPYLQSDRLLSKEKLSSVARVMGTSDGRKYLAKDERIFISGQQTETYWAIYRQVQEFERADPDANMIALRVVAQGELKESAQDYSGIEVTSQRQEVLINDIALPQSENLVEELSTTFYPAPAPQDVDAKILGSIDGIDYSAPSQVVILDKGKVDNLRQGHIFELYKASNNVYRSSDSQFSYEKSGSSDEISLPKSRIGELMIIRPYEYFSLALITRSTQPISRDILVVAPVQVDESATAQTP